MEITDCTDGVCTTGKPGTTTTFEDTGTSGTSTGSTSVQVFENTGTHIIYFNKDNCPYCDQIKDLINALESRLNGVLFERINVDRSANAINMLQALGSQGVPTLAIGINGGLQDVLIGPSVIQSAIESGQIDNLSQNVVPQNSQLPVMQQSKMNPIIYVGIGLLAYFLIGRR